MADIPTLERTRGGHKGQITKYLAVVEGHENGSKVLTLEECEALLTKLEKVDNKISVLNEKIFELCTTDDETTKAVDSADDFDTRLINITCRLQVIQKSLKVTSIPASAGSSSHNLVKLPRIDLPSFDGRYENWQSFQDLFLATVDNNSSLSGAQNLQYLKSCLKGEAANLIKSFTVTDTHYREAWGLMIDRYDNKREITNSLIKRIYQQQNVKTESALALQTLMDVTTECLRSLKVLSRPVDSWDDLIVFIIVEKLDSETRKEWAMSLKGTDPPTYKDLQEFLEQHIRGLQASGQRTSSRVQDHNFRERRQAASSHHTSADSSCPICKENHQIYHCQAFKSLTPEERSNKLRSISHCSNCLKSHMTKECTSQSSCRKCGKRHNTLLHFETRKFSRPPQPEKTSVSSNATIAIIPKSEPQVSSNPINPNSQTVSISSCSTIKLDDQIRQTLLMTAKVKLSDSRSGYQIVRAFLDPGSETSIITEECAKSLNLKRERVITEITGVSSAVVGRSRHQITVKLHSLVYDVSMEVEALVLPKVTSFMPRLPFDPSTWNHIQGLELADPDFHIPGKIDILLGADVIAAIERGGVIHGEKNSATAKHTLLGWVLFGKIASSIKQKSVVRVNHITANIDPILEKFWQLEELPIIKHFTEEEKACEQHFLSSHKRDSNGRYVLQLPFKPNIQNLGSSRDQAIRRLHYLERRFVKFPEYKSEYIKFMREYLSLGHMQVSSQDNVSPNQSFYLPHHFVLKESSSTTKFRVVFDGSAKSSSGLSLNNTLMVGPTIQDELFTLLLRFRTHVIALKADITKMYRQFKVTEPDNNYQKILWRESSDQPIREYNLLTVTYGTASAPFQATRCLQQLALDESNLFPLASKLLLSDMYVDDLMSGASTQEEAIQIQKELTQLVARGGMEIRKWMTSDPHVLQTIPPELCDKTDAFDLNEDMSVQALGVQWKPATDKFTFSVKPSLNSSKITKRQLLSDLARVFDPLGFLSPVTVNAKLIFQDLWKEEAGWDDPISPAMQSKWMSYQSEMPLIQSIMIPRCLVQPNFMFQEIHGFSDASEKAYSAVAYLRTVAADGTRMVRLIAAKTKVAPVKQVSIPRLELCGALLLTNLINSIKTSCHLSCPITVWTDSTTVLKWLSSFPGRWKTFVANRVAKIQGDLSPDLWRYVKSEDNPADCASRGILPEELLNSSMWWNGPSWLMDEEVPTFPLTEDSAAVKGEEKTKMINICHSVTDQSLLTRYSSLRRLIRTTAMIFRFVNNSRKTTQKQIGELSPTDLHSSLVRLVKLAQSSEFYQEIHCISLNKPIHPKSKLKPLNPFIDNEGVLRVGGRLQHADIPEDKKHQIILPHQNHLTWLIIRSCHIDTLHGGFQLLHSTLSRNYWITHGRDTIRHIIRKCIVCRKQRAEIAQQLMGSLPSPRVNPGPPFLQTGVDYAGPYAVLKKKGRGEKTFKCYFAVFVCFSTKAVHLEPVTDLTSEAFIACFKRFVSRRGQPSHMFSDCGTNFVGADKELRKMIQSNQYNENMTHQLADQGTQWHFNPPSAPHQGGLWEAGVKAVKFHLRRVVGNTNLTLEEFGTLLCNVEAILNSRPLCAMSPDPNDLNVLTPGHFLIGRPLIAVPEPDITDAKINRLSRWQVVQQITQHFWNRWSAEFLSSLQQRFKWTQKRSNLQVGDLVLIKDDNLPPTKWTMARVMETHPGADSLVRVVTLKTSTGILKRPIAKLSPILSVNEVDES